MYLSELTLLGDRLVWRTSRYGKTASPRGEAFDGRASFNLPLEGKVARRQPRRMRWRSLNQTNNPNLRKNAQKLRREMTKEERRLWYGFLKQLPITVNRQKVIGRYIVDFYCASAKLVIELDGSQHYEDEGTASDRERDLSLNSLGISVVRYSNSDVNRNFDGVCADLLRRLDLKDMEQAREDTSSVSLAADSFPSRGSL